METSAFTAGKSDGVIAKVGSRGVGNSAMNPTAPAVGNAIYHALSVRIKDLSITGEKILRGITENH